MRAASTTRRAHLILGAALSSLFLVSAGAADVPAHAEEQGSCDLAVLSRSGTGTQTQLLVTARAAEPNVRLQAAAFRLTQAGTSRQVALRPVAARDMAVAVVLSSSATTSGASYGRARQAALRLLAALPPGARAAVSAAGLPQQPTLSSNLALSAQAVQRAPAAPHVTGAAAAQAASRVLPPGGHVVLLTDGTHDGTDRDMLLMVRDLQRRQIVLDRLSYAPAGVGQGQALSTLMQPPCVSADVPVRQQVDQLLAVLASQYRLQAPLAHDSAQLSVRYANRTSSTLVPADSPALINPYPTSRPSPLVTGVAYLLAGQLALLGLLLLLRPERAERADRSRNGPGRDRSAGTRRADPSGPRPESPTTQDARNDASWDSHMTMTGAPHSHASRRAEEASPPPAEIGALGRCHRRVL